MSVRFWAEMELSYLFSMLVVLYREAWLMKKGRYPKIRELGPFGHPKK